MAKTGDFVRFLSDFLSYWTQINLSLAIAVERYILIVLATDAASLLSKQRRRRLYAFAISWVAVPPVCYFFLRVYLADDKYDVSLILQAYSNTSC